MRIPVTSRAAQPQIDGLILLELQIHVVQTTPDQGPVGLQQHRQLSALLVSGQPVGG